MKEIVNKQWLNIIEDLGYKQYQQACTMCREAYPDPNDVDCTDCEAKSLYKKVQSMVTRKRKQLTKKAEK